MSKFSDLIHAASQVRDASAEAENTALRVGSLFVNILQAIDAVLPDGVVDATAVSTSVSATNFVIKLKYVTNAGDTSTQTITIPVASTANAGLMSVQDRADLTKAITDSLKALDDASNALTNADAADSKAQVAIKAADDAIAKLNSLVASKGQPNGIAPLDANGLISSAYLPGYIDDVLEFTSIYANLPLQQTPSTKKSTDHGCIVAYNKATEQFVLGVFNSRQTVAPQTSESQLSSVKDSLLQIEDYDNFMTQLSTSDLSASDRIEVVSTAFTYYPAWADSYLYMEAGKPLGGKVYMSTSGNCSYRWSGTTLASIGSDLAPGYKEGTAYPGNEGAKNRAALNGINILPIAMIVNSITDIGNQYYEDDQNDGSVVYCRADYCFYRFVRANGAVLSTLERASEYMNGNRPSTSIIYRMTYPAALYRYNVEIADLMEFVDSEMLRLELQELVRHSTVSLWINVNESADTDEPLYNLSNALNAIEDRYRRPGVVLHFLADEDGNWETWQWKGDVWDSSLKWANTKAWSKLSAGGSQGNVINVNEIAPKSDGYYNRGSAANAVPEERRVGGRLITFMSAANTWQVWQYLGTTAEQWADENYWVQTVKGVSFNNSEPLKPDKDGVISLNYSVDVDQQLNAESQNPISNAAVAKELSDIQQGQVNALQISGQQLSLCTPDGAISTVTLPAGGGGTTNPTAIEITINSGMQDTVKDGDGYEVRFEWRHYNINTNVDTQYGGRVELIVNGSSVYTADVQQGLISLPVGTWLSVGTNSIIVKITADDGLIAQSPRIKPTVVTLNVSSPYNLATITEKGSTIPFRYVVTGSGSKIVHFKIDGKELPTETITTSGATSTKSITTSDLAHGAHNLEVWAEREISVNGETITLTSATLNLDLMVVEPSMQGVIIATETADNFAIEQYKTVVIPYAVYNPAEVTTDVEVSVNSVHYQSAHVDRSRQTLTYRAKNHGVLVFSFKSGNTTKVVNVEVKPADVQVNAETDALGLYLSSSGRTNAATDADVWQYTNQAGKTTKAQFINCGFDAQSGWKADDKGLVSLHLAGGAKCHIPYLVFGSDCKNTGKTIEIEFKISNCYDFDASLISCISGTVGFEVKAQECYFSSALKQRVGTKFKQDERMRIGFQVEEVSKNRFMYVFVNGIMCGVIQYDTSDYFVQNDPVGITLGNPSCELDVYNIRIYDNCLSQRQMVNNFIADMDDADQMFAKLEANDILNEDATEVQIDYDKVVQKIPCITFIGELPTYKGDKKKNTKVVYEDRQHPEFSFSCDKCQNDVQGTSSQYYPRKNWKFKFLTSIVMTQSGTTASKYALRAVDSNGNPVVQKPVKTFCLKADFAESSGTHNTGAANFINEVLVNSGIKTPPQMADDTVRTTIYGFPILMFHQADEQSPRVFIGKYNFNNDKSTQDTFGFEKISGYNKDMINRDDYLVYGGTLPQLQTDEKALAAAEDGDEYLMYLITATNHLAAYDPESGSWIDTGEVWLWDAASRCWKNKAGNSIAATDGLAKVKEGFLIHNNVECWEFLNNGDPMCLFHESDYTSRVGVDDKATWLDSDILPTNAEGKKTAPRWANAFEPRYPDNDDLIAEYANNKIPTQIKRVTDWLCTLNILASGLSDAEKAKMDAKFKAEFSLYFHPNFTLSYDNLRLALLMADQGAKNMMWAFFDGLCYPIFYDNDTVLGLNNEGRNQFSPYVEPHDKDALGKFVFNGESSVLWNMIERNFSEEENSLFATLVSQGGLTYARALYWFNTTQSDKWCETVYNADSDYKYIQSFGVAGQGDGLAQNYLDIAQGSREAHRKWMLFERLAYLNAKRCTGTYRESYVYLRANTAGSSSVPGKVAVKVTAAQDWYFGFRFSGNAGYSSRLLRKGETYEFTAPAGSNPNDTECYIHQADRISDLGDLSVLYPTTLMVTQCKMLESLVVGNEKKGYIGKLATLTLGNHPLLKMINVVNCPTLSSSLNLVGCTALEYIYAQGSKITATNLPAGSVIKAMHLPETLVQIQFDSFPNLAYDNLVIDGYQQIQSVSIVSCPNLDSVKILEDIMNTPNNSLQYVKLTDINLQGDGQVLLELLDAGIKGADNRNGKPEIYGQYTLTKILPIDDVQRIVDPVNGIVGLVVTTGLYAFIDRIDEINAESYAGDSEVDEVTFDNIGDHMLYYNGETAVQYTARIAAENVSIHDIIKQ